MPMCLSVTSCMAFLVSQALSGKGVNIFQINVHNPLRLPWQHRRVCLALGNVWFSQTHSAGKETGKSHPSFKFAGVWT